MRKITYYSGTNSSLVMKKRILFHQSNSRIRHAKLNSFLYIKDFSLGLFTRQLDLKSRGLA